MAKTEKLSLAERLMKSNTLQHTAFLDESRFFVEEFYDTGITALNVAFSAKVDGGISKGSTIVSGASKTFKTLFMLTFVKAYLKRYEDSIFVYYDVEFGSNVRSFESMGIDPSRVIHKPFSNVEQIKHDMKVLLEEITQKDRVIIGVDSFGAMASLKEEEDALSGKTVADMSRAKAIKSFWRVINPLLNIKNVPLIGIGQTYKSQDFFPKNIIGGGTGMEYFPNNSIMVTKSSIKDKSKENIIGSYFNITVHKGRLTKEQSKFPIKVTYESGIDKYSALLDIGLELGFIKKEKEGKSYVYWSEKKPSLKVSLEDSSTPEFWEHLINHKEIQTLIYNRYSLSSIDPVETTGIVIEDGYDTEEEPTKPKSKK